MLGDKGIELLQELRRSELVVGPNSFPAFNDECVRCVLEEMNELFQNNQDEVRATTEGEKGLVSGIHIRHTALERNQRCLLTYAYTRQQKIRQLRWELGGVIEAQYKSKLHEEEVAWFNKYSRCLGKYMSNIGGGIGLDLTKHRVPPKSLYTLVRCIMDYGEFETEDGTSILLNKNTQHYMKTSQCEGLIRRGIVEHIV